MSDKKKSGGLKIEELMKLRTSNSEAHLEAADFDDMLNEMISMKKRLAHQDEMIQGLEQEAMLDPVTNLANRRVFEQELERSLSAARRYGRQHGLLMIDVNDFKAINDRLGHVTGDNVLRHVARLLEQNTRPTDVVARFGGDEFCVILNELNAIENGEMRARAISEMIESTPYIGERNTVAVSASVGCYVFGADDDLEDIMRHADTKMYEQKGRMKG